LFSSYSIYILTLVCSTLCAALAQKFSYSDKNGVRKPNILFWYSSMGILVFIMGFRVNTVGVDDLNYLNNYNIANSMSILQYYKIYVTEPGFYLLSRIVYFTFNDFQWLIVVTSLLTIFLFYKALEFEIKNISLSLGVFVFILTQYFYYFGIIRMGLAVAIIAYAYRFVMKKEYKKFIVFVFLATMFHYSAVFALGIMFITVNINSSSNLNKKNTIKIFLLIPISFILVRQFIYPFISTGRYQNYINSTELISWGFITSIPLLILFYFNYKKLSLSNEHFQFYYFLYLMKVITELFSPIIGIGRMVWYLNLSICVLFPAIIKANKNYVVRYILYIIIILYCVYYSYSAYFGDSLRSSFMLPYENVIINLFK